MASVHFRSLRLLIRELAFRAYCRHRQGDKANILLYCTRRSGSTWLLNTLAAHPGMRYVARPFHTVRLTRWRHRMPNLKEISGDDSSYYFQHPIHFEGETEQQFLALADDIINARIHVYPTMNVRGPYFNRVTDRIVFQMTFGTALIEWFAANFDVKTAVLFRHPISNALSIMRANWRPECEEFLRHRWFRENVLNDEQRDMGDRIVRDGTELEKHVFDWCCKMIVPWRAVQSGRHPDWLVMTYERTVREPEAVVHDLSKHLDLPDTEAMLPQVRRPSRTVTSETASRVRNPDYLLNRWRDEVREDQARSLMTIVHAFGINLYDDESAGTPAGAWQAGTTQH